MRNTTPDLPIEQRQSNELIEDLCLALRDVGVWTWSLPKDERAISAIENVQTIYGELLRRKVDFQSRIKQLSEETSWQMQTLLEECIDYPQTIPYVRDIDGVRRAFRCSVCEQREYPDREGLFLCDVCLDEAKTSFETLLPFKYLLLFRIYNKEYWCRHANSETVLMAFNDYDELGQTWCKQCVIEEQSRRTK
jgi:hypothetical protein